MAILEQVQSDTRDAMKAGERDRVAALRLITDALQKDLKSGGDDEVAVLRRERKRRLEAADAYRDGGSAERAESEEAEAREIERYLPAELSDADLEAAVDEAIAESGRERARRHGQGDGRGDAEGRRPRRRQAGQRGGPRPARGRLTRMGSPATPRTRMTHGCRRWIAPVVLARTHEYGLRPPFTTSSAPCAPAHVGSWN